MDQSGFKGKNVLYFQVKNFGSYNLIINKLTSYGAKVYHFDERPANNNLTKGILRFAPQLIRKNIINYYKDILKQTTNIKFDYLLVIRGEVVPKFFLEELKKTNPQCEFIFYNWDSFKNTPNTSSHLDCYDRAFSFDTFDAVNHKVNFLPLFFYDEFREDSCNLKNEIDLLFLGTAHSDRYIIANKLKKWCNENNLVAFNYFFMQGKLVYPIKRIIDPTFKKFDYKELSFISLDTKDMVDFYKKSNVILDINHPYQTGLTMRTFEAIGAKKKLITTNKEIVNYPFYNVNNFYIIDRENLILEKSFFETNFIPLEDNLYEKVSLDGWLKYLFFESDFDYWNNMLKNK